MGEVGFVKRLMEDSTVDEDVKMGLKGLVKEGRLEIVNGGLSANDESCSYYESIMD